MSWRLGVVGTPIAHSLTPAMHRAALEATGLTGTSQLFDIGLENESALDSLFDEIDAVSVTMPLKAALMKRCDDVDEVASRIGAVNTVMKRDGRWVGRSTDGVGFLDAVKFDFNLDVQGRDVVVLGSGGAARSIVDACVRVGAQVIVLARNRDAASALADQYDRVIANPPQVEAAALVVRAFPGGADPEIPSCTVKVTDEAVAIDISYQPPVSTWLAEQAQHGRRTANGLGMLAHQAQHQLEWWFDRAVPIEPLRRAVGL